ncbi:hypothetical protein C1645_816379 [Glomus cerebriforme]|uniref:Uncharacterized protein n=1 Tax=Glomus cerebriforme TaxID=658196 RepID=A0A397TBS4_9GLOM|nr:hypothetical protein C1645_816379 [Glomus cerebriforme]
MLYPGEYMKVNNKVLCDQRNQSIEQNFEEDEFEYIKNVHEHDKKVNQKYCNGSKCKFLLAYFPPAMDTSITNIEYLTYVKLAESLGRIMVLTNVGSKRISTCQQFPFSLYYDVDRLQKNYPKVKFITQNEFQQWSHQRYDKPSTSHYYLTDGGEENSVNDLPPYSDSLKKIWCFDKFKLKLNNTTPFKQLRVSWNSWDENNNGRDILKNFLINNLQDNSDVLLIRHDIREPLFVSNLPSLPYAKHINDAAIKITNSLRPYIAVHWDVEHTEGSALSTCAPNLLYRIQKTIDRSSIENIYFVSDYPLRYLNDIISSNSTQPFIKSSHHFSYIHTKTMDLITSTIPYHTADSLGVMKYFEDVLKDELEDSSSIRDIIDKLVCINADRYIALPKWPCNELLDSKRSKMIAEIRSLKYNEESSVIRF